MTKIKVKDGENLSTTNIERVIGLLNQEKPITKKAACEILNISYNTARLNKIIENHSEEKEYASKRRKLLRKQAISTSEIKYIVESYLSGDPLSGISEKSHRSTNVIKNVLYRFGVPLRNAQQTYSNPVFIDDKFISLNYEIGDLVYAARYNCPAYIEKVCDDPIHEKVYRIRLVGQYRRQAVQPYYELANFKKLQIELKIVLHEMSDEEINNEIALALINARKRSKKDDK